jgi:hypothetical protein
MATKRIRNNANEAITGGGNYVVRCGEKSLEEEFRAVCAMRSCGGALPISRLRPYQLNAAVKSRRPNQMYPQAHLSLFRVPTRVHLFIGRLRPWTLCGDDETRCGEATTILDARTLVTGMQEEALA